MTLGLACHQQVAHRPDAGLAYAAAVWRAGHWDWNVTMRVPGGQPGPGVITFAGAGGSARGGQPELEHDF